MIALQGMTSLGREYSTCRAAAKEQRVPLRTLYTDHLSIIFPQNTIEEFKDNENLFNQKYTVHTSEERNNRYTTERERETFS